MNFLLLGLYIVGTIGAVLLARRFTNLVVRVLVILVGSVSLSVALSIEYALTEYPAPQCLRCYVVFSLLSWLVLVLLARHDSKVKKKRKRKNAE